MLAGKSDEAWEYYGKNDPYFGVLTWEGYKNNKLTKEAQKEFFATGERYIDSVVKTIQEHFNPAFRPVRALDFGCGVGRLALPLARLCDSVVGVDVSESMLATAEKNCKEQGLTNVTFVKSDDALSGVTGTVDFVHSFIVFQHITPKRGLAIFRRLIDLLQDDGIGVLHLTYSYARSASTLRRLLTAAQHEVPFVNGFVNLLRGRRFGEPLMQMNEYSVNRLLQILQESNCHELHLRFTETSVRGHGFYGASFFFRKRALDVRAHA